MQDIKVEIVSPDDAEELLQIYAPYVTGTAITFDRDYAGGHRGTEALPGPFAEGAEEVTVW